MIEPGTQTDPALQADAAKGLEAPLLFIGGTGRSGTHVVARMLSCHPDYANVPVEARFHCDPGGFPDLLAGETTPRRFARRLRGRWWRRVDPVRRAVYGIRKFVPRERIKGALDGFDARFDADPESACRELFWSVLGPLAEAAGKPGLVEQSCDTVAVAPVLQRIFPEARFVHVIRDGRDVAASRSGQTRGLVYPRNIRQGLEWWEERLRRLDAGASQLPDDTVRVVNLDNLVEFRRTYAVTRLTRFVGPPSKQIRRFHRTRMSPESAHRGRWRDSLSSAAQREIDEAYEQAVDRLIADGIAGAASLRNTRSWDRQGGRAHG
jgi:hypothetical protein